MQQLNYKLYSALFIPGLLLTYLIIFSFNLHISLFDVAYVYDHKRILQTFLLASILILLIVYPYRKPGVTKPNHPLHNSLLFLVLLLGVASSINADFPAQALLELSIYTALFLLSQFAYQVYRIFGYRFIWFISVILIISGFVFLIGVFTNTFATLLESKPLNWHEIILGFAHHRFFNQFQVLTLALLSLPLLVNININPSLKKLSFLIISGWWFMLFMLGSRGALIAIILGLIITWLVYRKSSLALLKLQFSAGIIGFFVYWLLFNGLPLFLPVTEIPELKSSSLTLFRYNSSGRIDLWVQALHLIQSSPLLGVGPMHYFGPDTNPLTLPHNAILFWAAEYGIPSTLLVFFLCCSGIYRWIIRYNYTTLKLIPNSEKQLVISLFFSLTAGILYSMVSGVIAIPLSQVMMAIIIGLMQGYYHCDAHKKTLNKELYTTWQQRLIAGMVLVTLTYTAFPGLTHRLKGKKVEFTHSHEKKYPRTLYRTKIVANFKNKSTSTN